MPVIYAPAIENLHSLLILAWCEYGGGREQGEYRNSRGFRLVPLLTTVQF
jgi:hypothetical protein